MGKAKWIKKLLFCLVSEPLCSKVVLQTVIMADNLRERSTFVFFMFMNIKANALFSNYSERFELSGCLHRSGFRRLFFQQCLRLQCEFYVCASGQNVLLTWQTHSIKHCEHLITQTCYITRIHFGIWLFSLLGFFSGIQGKNCLDWFHSSYSYSLTFSNCSDLFISDWERISQSALLLLIWFV